MKPNSQEKKRCKEERARRILIRLFPEKYQSTCLSESPDIVSLDNKFGVEVTDALKPEVHQSLVRNTSYEALGCAHQIKTAYRKKLDKLNKPHFKKFRENELFMFAETIEEDELEDGLEAIKSVADENNKYRFLFDRVYIYKQGELVEFNLSTYQEKRAQLSKEIIDEITSEVLSAIVGITKEEYLLGGNKLDY